MRGLPCADGGALSPRKVLLVHSSSGRYGADRQLYLIAAGLDRRRYVPIVVLPDRGPLAFDLAAASIEVVIRPISVLRRELLHPLGLASLSAAAARDAGVLGGLIRRRGISLVHSNTSVVLGGAAAAALAGVPHIWHVREIYSRFGRAWPAYRRLLTTASALPCVSAAVADQFLAGAPVTVIHDGLAVPPKQAARVQARSALGLELETAVIAVLGRISDWKGQDMLIRALAEAPLREISAVGLIAGDVWPGAARRLTVVLDLARALGVSERLRLLGFRDDVETVYGAADIVAIPSTEPDPLPGAAIEAAAAGCAVIATAHGGLPEIIREGETGRLVAPRDARALARVARELLDEPAQRERLGAAAAQDARARFAPRRLLESIHALYDGL